MILNKFKFLFFPVLFCLAYFISSNSLLKENDSDYLTVLGLQEKTELQKSIIRGRNIYIDFCVQCHLANGKGDMVNFPPLDRSDWLLKKRKQSIQAVKYGQSGVILVNGNKYNNAMPYLALENQEVADVMNYIMNSWSNRQNKMVTVAEVKAIIKI